MTARSDASSGLPPQVSQSGEAALLPCLNGRRIVCLSSIDWDFNQQGHQQVMSALAAGGNPVLFIENTGVRTPGAQDLPRLLARIKNRWRSNGGLRREREGLTVHAPLVLPFPYACLARPLNRALVLRYVRRWMRTAGFHAPVFWTFLPTPLALDLIEALHPALTVYYCVDDIPETSRSAQRTAASETRLFREADLVFVTAERLRARAASVRSQVDVFPFGVDLELFERVRSDPAPLPTDVAFLPRPLIGFVGEVKRWIDQTLLIEVATRMPHCTFVLVGPIGIDPSRLARCPNVHLLGPRPHAEVPRYLKAFDVAIIPYRLINVTAAIYPAKLNEYLAMALPVVATPIAELVRFNAANGDLVTLASDPGAFAAAIGNALGRPAPDAIARRLAAARSNAWAPRIARMMSLVEARLAGQRDGPRHDPTSGMLTTATSPASTR